MTTRSVEHTSFSLERDFAAAPERVFRAWSDADAKRSWFVCDPDMKVTDYRLDFRPGGRETNQVEAPDGSVHRFQGFYLDIVENERLIYAFDMLLGETRISASLATIEFRPRQGGTRMVYTEQVAFLDGYQDREERIRGTDEGFDNLRQTIDLD
jgi:uncharacterized protein YndB with AHSA1/START domain